MCSAGQFGPPFLRFSEQGAALFLRGVESVTAAAAGIGWGFSAEYAAAQYDGLFLQGFVKPLSGHRRGAVGDGQNVTAAAFGTVHADHFLRFF